MALGKAKVRSGLVIGTLMIASGLVAATPASPADKEFVGKVSQGGMYEVEAGRVAMRRAKAQDVKDLAAMDVHDHELVGAKLKRVSASKGVSMASTLNGEFAARLEKLKSASDLEFDAAYVLDMSAIHDKDVKLFIQESTEGSEGYKEFAAETARVVRRHIGAFEAKVQ